SGESLLLAMDLFWGASAPLALRGSQYGGRGHSWVLADGADRIYPVDDDKPVRPVFYGYLSHPEKGETPFCNSWYGRAPWLWVQSVDERSEEHTSELQSRFDLVCRLLLAKKKKM